VVLSEARPDFAARHSEGVAAEHMTGKYLITARQQQAQQSALFADLMGKRESASCRVLGSESMSPNYPGGRDVEGFTLASGWFGHNSQTTGILVFLSARMLKKLLPHHVDVEAYERSCTSSQRKLRQ
jgi:hypothetical protein